MTPASQYTIKELEDTLAHIDAASYPERARELREALERKRAEAAELARQLAAVSGEPVPLPRSPLEAYFAFLARRWRWLVFGGLAVVLVFVSFLFAIMKQNDAYRGAVEAVRRSEDARAVIGDPIEPGWIVTGSINVTGASGHAALSFGVSGPKGEGTVYLVADKVAGAWRYSVLELAPAVGRARVDLLR